MPTLAALAVVVIAFARFMSPISPFGAVQADVGDVDLSFGQNGAVSIPALYQDTSRVAIQADGRIVVVYRSARPGSITVDTYLSNGTLDWRETVPGTVSRTPDPHILGLRIRPDGKIVVAYTVGTKFRITVFRPNGMIYSTFGSDGHLSLDDFSDLEILPGNRVVVVDESSLRVYDTNGSFVSSVSSPSLHPHRQLAVAPEGRLVVTSGDTLTRYNADLSPDSSFCGGGPCYSPFPIFNVEVANDGKIVTGNFSLYPATMRKWPGIC